jgi:hypothetical protein
MIYRCTNSNAKNYKDYGGRGITVCDRWLGKNGFINFLIDMGEPPGPGYSIERINNNLGYFKENCRWATPKEQARNTKRNHLITYNRKTQCIAAWAEELGMKYHAILARIKRGWTIEKTLMTPLQHRRK